MDAKESMLKTILKSLLICILLGTHIQYQFASAEDDKALRPTKGYPKDLVPRNAYSGGDEEGHCVLWSTERSSGGKAECRRRADRPSKAKIKCRFKRSFPNKDDPELLMCVYERAGYKKDELTISSEGGLPCVKEFLCKQE